MSNITKVENTKNTNSYSKKEYKNKKYYLGQLDDQERRHGRGTMYWKSG